MFIITLLLGYLIGLLPSWTIAYHLVDFFDSRVHGQRDRGLLTREDKRIYPITLAFDLGKGMLAVGLGILLGGRLSAAYGVLLGQTLPFHRDFRGDRGIVVYLGSLLLLLPITIPLIGLSWLIAYYLTQRMSLAIILSFSIITPVYMIMASLPLQYGIFGIIAGLTIGFYYHQDLMEGL